MNTSTSNNEKSASLSSLEGSRHPQLARKRDFNLSAALNLYFQIGCQTFTRHELLAYGAMDQIRVMNCLLAWESRGLIKIFVPLEEAEDSEIVVKVLQPIKD